MIRSERPGSFSDVRAGSSPCFLPDAYAEGREEGWENKSLSSSCSWYFSSSTLIYLLLRMEPTSSSGLLCWIGWRQCGFPTGSCAPVFKWVWLLSCLLCIAEQDIYISMFHSRDCWVGSCFSFVSFFCLCFFNFVLTFGSRFLRVVLLIQSFGCLCRWTFLSMWVELTIGQLCFHCTDLVSGGNTLHV